MISKEQQKAFDKLDEVICIRESKFEQLKSYNRIIEQGIRTVKSLPSRWYVRNPNEAVCKYLEQKFNRELDRFYRTNIGYGTLDGTAIGYGELHGQFAFIPHDVNYSWEITQEEFDLALSLIEQGD